MMATPATHPGHKQQGGQHDLEHDASGFPGRFSARTDGRTAKVAVVTPEHGIAESRPQGVYVVC